jgi:hypothetical protein
MSHQQTPIDPDNTSRLPGLDEIPPEPMPLQRFPRFPGQASTAHDPVRGPVGAPNI